MTRSGLREVTKMSAAAAVAPLSSSLFSPSSSSSSSTTPLFRLRSSWKPPSSICLSLSAHRGNTWPAFRIAAITDPKIVPLSSDPEIGSGGGGEGSGSGGGGDGSGGGGNGDDENNSEGGSEELRSPIPMSMSQKLTLAYAALVGAGGVIGYLKSGSNKSLAAGGMSTLILYYVYTQLPLKPAFASSLGLGLSVALLGVMGSRFIKSKKVFPAGVVSLVSFVMTGGYFHGILRSRLTT